MSDYITNAMPPSPTTEETTNMPERKEDNTPIIYNNDDFDESKPKVFVGGRKSKLAVIQSQLVSESLRTAHPNKRFPVLAISTLGDQVSNKPLYSFGGKALWTKELETLLLEGNNGYKVDMIVHSLKDMPTTLPEGCVLGAITKREDPRDALIMPIDSPHKTLADLPAGSVVGTSSIRRSAQLKRRYPSLQFEDIRGSVNTRLAKLDDPNSKYACTILAVAGLVRLGLGHRITSQLEAPDMYHAVGQGALGIEIRQNDERTLKMLSAINDTPSSLCCRAERSLMKTLEGGCSVPIGVQSTYDEKTASLTLNGIVVSVDGTQCVEDSFQAKAHTDQEAEAVGRQLAHTLIQKGAKDILDEIHL
jgi:hydroxymethylbilane synthase